jgi:hypothetical protein
MHPFNTEDEGSVEMPIWALALSSLGEALHSTVSDDGCHPFTIALCLPRVDFAAVFIGAGIISKHLSSGQILPEEQRMKQLIGKSVVLDKGDGNTTVGTLEYCDVYHDYKISEFDRSKKSTSAQVKVIASAVVLDKKDWCAVRPAGRQFSSERRVGRHQIEKLNKHASASKSLGSLLGLSLHEIRAEEARCLFTIFGTRRRLHDELTQDLEQENNSSLAGVLRPQYLPEFASAFRCRVESRGGQPTEDCGILLLEASRNLGDHLAATRAANRVILLGRNSADYEECANTMIADFAIRGEMMPGSVTNLPATIKSLAFYNS